MLQDKRAADGTVGQEESGSYVVFSQPNRTTQEVVAGEKRSGHNGQSGRRGREIEKPRDLSGILSLDKNKNLVSMMVLDVSTTLMVIRARAGPQRAEVVMLIDSGAQRSFVTLEALKRFDAGKPIKDVISVSGFGGQKTNTECDLFTFCI